MLVKRPFNHSIKVNPASPLTLPAMDDGAADHAYQIHVNGRWLCYDHSKQPEEHADFKETDRYPVMVTDTRTGHIIYCTEIALLGTSRTVARPSDEHSSRNSVRVQTVSEIVIY